jgi:hypothetical protein
MPDRVDRLAAPRVVRGPAHQRLLVGLEVGAERLGLVEGDHERAGGGGHGLVVRGVERAEILLAHPRELRRQLHVDLAGRLHGGEVGRVGDRVDLDAVGGGESTMFFTAISFGT